MNFRLDDMMNLKSGEISEMEFIIKKIKTRNRPHIPVENAFSDNINIIAELKHSSPSKGHLAAEGNDNTILNMYINGGASAISVLTEKNFFGGSYDNLLSVASSCDRPVLCKDFICFEEQVEAAYLCGADMVLLIATILDRSTMKKLYDKILSFGMTPVVEIHDKKEIDYIMFLKPGIILVNMRNLKTLEINMKVGIETLKKIPPEITVISASGINSAHDISYIMDECGAHNFLVGSSLMQSNDPENMIREFKNVY